MATNGVQQVDPMGNSPVIPFATPATAYEAPADATAPQGFAAPATGLPPAPEERAARGGLRSFLDTLGADGHRRPEPVSSVSVAGIGGFIASFGVLLLIIGNDVSNVDDVRGKLFLSSILTLAGVYAIRFLVHHQPQVRSAAVGAAAPAIVSLGGAITWENTADAWALFVIALLLLAAWAAPGLRGRPLMLALGALFVVAAVGRATASDGGDSGLVPRGTSDVIGNQGIVFLFLGMLLLLGVYLLDEAGYEGVGTSLVTAALISTWVGVGLTVPKLDDTPGSLVVIVAGLVVGFVGTHGARRATAWIGAWITATGTVSFMVSVMQPFKKSTDLGVMLLVSGVLLVGGAAGAAAIIRSRKNTPKDDTTPSTMSAPDPTAVFERPQS